MVICRESSGIQKILGGNGVNVLSRLFFAFILLAIGVQVLLAGLNGYAIEFFT